MVVTKNRNIDLDVVKDFGDEWGTYTQIDINEKDTLKAFCQYFDIFPFDKLKPDSEGFDMGCGSGRWADLVSLKVGTLNCIEPSEKALNVAKKRLKNKKNCKFYCGAVGDKILSENSQDFGYSLGVLHHIPDTQKGIDDCAKLLKKGAPFLLYLYYNFENRPLWFKLIWKTSDFVRKVISIMPFKLKKFVTSVIAILVYFPLSRLALLLEKIGVNVDNIPLSDYRNKPFYFLCTDALDRFGTKLEKRFSKKDIQTMLEKAGFENITFSAGTPYWVCLSYKV